MNARFDLTTPAYHLRTHGVAQRIYPQRLDGASVAQAIDEAMADVKAKRLDGRAGPIVVGLVPFDAEADPIFYIPEQVEFNKDCPNKALTKDEKRNTFSVNGIDSPAYRQKVTEALTRIESGDLDKVVLARSVTVEFDAPIDIGEVYARLCARNGSAYVYRVDLPDNVEGAPSVLLGASPELVLSSEKGKIRSTPLAGSIPRAADPLIDQKVARDLLKSKKDLAEHSLVVQAVGETFRQFADKVEVPSQPQLVQTPVIWHLGTYITGVLRENVSPIALAYALHPTPAVGGWPREAAQKTITELEGFDRGFYAGLIGWMDDEGNGEWVLTLRCGIISGKTATVFAGAGIVAGSDPEKEHTETGTKLQTFINALG
ncbi:isochorismate synthase [Agrobacterium burrii]|uniref:isochorismate synthase n=1 Tax=Agrobacterium burrii TaxID=2815339 RepID=A0ABS3EJT6_9HYPH|nr:isochorismate synthase [Agrobacterium burrii]MBO0132027.1 isochorismate synthase [Agrobacterium burrii]